MISVQELSVYFGGDCLFNAISFMLKQTDRIGLVGKNGAGKSTLLKLIAGELTPDNGQVAKPKGIKIGYLPQHMKHNESITVLEEAQNALQEIKEIDDEINNINLQLQQREDYESQEYLDLIEKLNELNSRLGILDGYNVNEKIEKILFGLGFERTDLGKEMSTFSGGWKMRVELAKILLQEPEVLLLDEPTNHLDIISIQWLENFLIQYKGALILISHDRSFLDAITNRTIEIANNKIYDYKSPYSKYLIQRKEERERLLETQKNQQKEVAQTEKLINKFRAKQSKASFAQSLIKKLDKMEMVEVENENSSAMRIKFPPVPRSGKIAIEAKGISKTYEDKIVISNAEFIIGRGEKVALVGKNGMGKTTLMKIITGEISHEGAVELGHNVEIGYFAQNQADLLDVEKTVFETIDDEAKGEFRLKVRTLLGSFLFSGDDIEKKVKVLSGGEKTRLALCLLLLRPINLLLLDEPTNHLDIQSKEILKNALIDFEGTLIIVSHDRDFLHGLSNRIYEIKDKRISIYHEDIFDFLKLKNNESIKDFENEGLTIDEKQTITEKDSSSSKLSYEEKKQQERDKRKLNNQLSKCEQKIENLEQEIKKLDNELANLDYSNQDNANNQLENYKKVKVELEKTYEIWENTQKMLEKFT